MQRTVADRSALRYHVARPCALVNGCVQNPVFSAFPLPTSNDALISAILRQQLFGSHVYYRCAILSLRSVHLYQKLHRKCVIFSLQSSALLVQIRFLNPHYPIMHSSNPNLALLENVVNHLGSILSKKLLRWSEQLLHAP